MKPQRDEKPKPKGGAQSKPRDDEDDGVTGFGDDLPGFLMRK